MAEKSIVKIQERVAALSSLGRSDLDVQEQVDALVATAMEVSAEKKEASERDTEVKNEFKRMCREHMDAGEAVTCYSWDNGMKMTLIPKGGGIEVDEVAFLNALYEKFGEEPGDQTGRAWAAYCAVSDPIEVPRKLNMEKLEREVLGGGMVDGELLGSVSEQKPPTYAASCTKISKAELEAHAKGELDAVTVVR